MTGINFILEKQNKITGITFENIINYFDNLVNVPNIEKATSILPVLMHKDVKIEWIECCYACLAVPVPEGIYGLRPVKQYCYL
jgi:hypothetical protein